MAGGVFGELSVISEAGRNPVGQVTWNCLCSCGAVVVKSGHDLRSGRVKSCGHLKTEERRSTCIGEVHGGVAVLSSRGPAPSYEVVARCTCGVEFVASYYNLKRGRAKGCRTCSLIGVRLAAESRRTGRDYRTHCSYRSMVARCTNRNLTAYANYGGRGIEVCPRWLDSPDLFETDMGVRPEGRSLERVDNSKGYSPDNCVWATAKEQVRNTRVNVNLTLLGATRCVSEWAEILNVPAANIYARIKRNGHAITADWLSSKGVSSAIHTG